MIFITTGLLEVALENWPKWDVNGRPPKSVQSLQLTELSGHEFKSHSKPTLYSYSNLIVCSVSHVFSTIAFVSRLVYFNGSFDEVIT